MLRDFPNTSIMNYEPILFWLNINVVWSNFSFNLSSLKAGKFGCTYRCIVLNFVNTRNYVSLIITFFHCPLCFLIDSDEYVKKNVATLIREIAKHTPEVKNKYYYNTCPMTVACEGICTLKMSTGFSLITGTICFWTFQIWITTSVSAVESGQNFNVCLTPKIKSIVTTFKNYIYLIEFLFDP